MKNDKNLQFSGKIVLQAIYSKDQRFHASPVRDLLTGGLKGVTPMTEEEKKKQIYVIDENTGFTVQNGVEIDLSTEYGRKTWAWLQHCPEIAAGFEEAQASHAMQVLFYVSNEEREAEASLSEADLIFKAMGYVKDDKPENYEMRVRLLGLNMSGEKPKVIKEYLMKQARNPKTAGKIIWVYESSDVSIHLLFLKAKDKEVIKLVNGAFMYGDIVLGIREEAVLAYLQDPTKREIVEQIDKEVNPQNYSKSSKAMHGD